MNMLLRMQLGEYFTQFCADFIDIDNELANWLEI